MGWAKTSQHFVRTMASMPSGPAAEFGRSSLIANLMSSGVKWMSVKLGWVTASSGGDWGPCTSDGSWLNVLLYCCSNRSHIVAESEVTFPSAIFRGPIGVYVLAICYLAVTSDTALILSLVMKYIDLGWDVLSIFICIQHLFLRIHTNRWLRHKEVIK